jgi:hypothetical protein
MAAIKILLQWRGADGPNPVAHKLMRGARQGTCTGNYDSKVWQKVDAVLQGPFRVLFSSECWDCCF